MNKYNYFLFSNTEEPRALEVDKNCIAGLSLTGDLDEETLMVQSVTLKALIKCL